MFAFTFEIPHYGWAEAHFTIGTATVRLEASYLSDALGDLLGSVRSLINGERRSMCIWQEEPCQNGIFLERRPDDRVRVHIAWTSDALLEYATQLGAVLLMDSVVAERELVGGIVHGTKEMLALYGVEGYNDLWELYTFPEADLRALEDWLATH